MKNIWLAEEDSLRVTTMKKLQKRLSTLPKTTLIQTLFILGFLFFTFSTIKIPITFESTFNELSSDKTTQISTRRHNNVPIHARLNSPPSAPTRPVERVSHHALSKLALHWDSDLANTALAEGRRLWSEAEANLAEAPGPDAGDTCPGAVTVTGREMEERGHVAAMRCGMTVGSSVTVVGRVRGSEFRVELLGLKGEEEPARVLHMNPRLRGDWSGKPVIEINTCYRMKWGSALRCDGWPSRADEETVDGKVKCEKWILGNNITSEEAKTKWWLNKLIGSRTKKLAFEWPFPFLEDKLFVLTISARLEGYHINVDGRHVASFPYRSGFTLEDATGISVNGDVEVHSVIAASLPSMHPSLAPRRSLDMSGEWRAPPVPEKGGVELFIGVLSAGNHFAERMAVRKSWMRHKLVRSSVVVARFFVALHARKEVNAQLKKEAEFFGDIVIVPYLDNYDLVVLKTVAICEHGVRSIPAKNVMKCDDDTFINVDAVLGEAREIPEGESFYVGNINYFHRPLRSGKWAVTPEEWPEEVYPPYANGPGYIMSSDIANFTVSEFERNKLRLFKMEDVSMGMWVEKFNETTPVNYVHSLRFCQFGCIEDYYTAHYQSPRQMICMWEKLQRGTRPQCCGMR